MHGLLARCRRLVGPGGLIICEVDPDPDRSDCYHLVLADPPDGSDPVPWSSIGFRSLQRISLDLDLVVVEEWRAGGRAFASLRSAA